jgi:hypothetical protein
VRRALPICLVLLAALAIRVHRIADHNIWWDEAFSIVMARLPLREMAVRTAADVHPPLHYAFLHYWTRLVGEGEYAVRYSTALFGVLDLALLYWLGRRYLGWATAFCALCLVALNRLHVEWSQEIRMYTLATALVLGSTACFLRLTADGDRRLRWWLGHLVLSVVGLHTIYIFGLAPLAQSTAIAVNWLRGRASARFALTWLGVQAAAVTLFVPWVLLYLRQPHGEPVSIYPIDLLTWLRAVFTALPVGVSAYLDGWTPVLVVATSLLLIPLALDRTPCRTWLFLSSYLALLAGPLVIYALSFPNPLLYAPNLSVRYLILFLPLYALLVGRALVLLSRRWRWPTAGLGAAAALVCAYTTVDLYASRYLRDEYRTIASFMASYEQPDDVAVLYSDWEWPVYQYYAPRDLPSVGVSTRANLTPASAAELGAGYLAGHQGVWLVALNDAYDADPNGYLRQWLEGHARVLADFRVDNKRLTLFTRDPARTLALPVPPRGQAVFSPGPPSLRSVEVPVHELNAGETLHIATFWQGPGVADAVDHVELVAPDGGVVRRVGSRLRPDWPSSAWPAGATVRVDQAVPTSDRLPSGSYTLRLGLNDLPPVPIARLGVRPPEVPPAPPMAPPAPPLPARHDRFGGQIDLVGADPARPELVAGKQLRLRLLWQAVTAMERPYTAFVQLVGTATNPATGNRVWAQQDAPPDRAHATADWLPGDLALDERTLEVPASLPDGQYQLIVGLYDQADGRRLALPDGKDFAVLATYP